MSYANWLFYKQRARDEAPTFPPPQEESVVLEGTSFALLDNEAYEAASLKFGSHAPVRITISPLKENKTDDK